MDNAPVQEEPRDIEAEKAVLGAAFLSKNALADAMEYLEPQDFTGRLIKSFLKRWSN